MRSVLCVLLAAIALVASPAAQTPQRPPVFRSGVDVVQLDVSVVDKDRRPVRGLTAADFTVLEDGIVQPIVGFEAVHIDDPPPPPTAWMRDVTPDVADNSLAESRLFVLVIDDALIPMDPAIIKDAKQVVRTVVDKLGPTDLTAVVFTADNRRTQDFTNDRAKLLATIDKFLPGMATYRFPPPPPVPGSGPPPPGLRPDPNTDTYYFLSSISTLGRVADFLIEIPHRRKALIWVSPGVPVDIEDATQLGPASAAARDMMDRTAEVMQRAARANVAIYPIDPTGLGGMQEYIARYNTGDVAHRKSVMSLDFLAMAAANTGGRAIVNTNDFGPGIEQVFQENSSYYLIGFRPTNTKIDGTLRRLEVKVNRPGLDVRTRRGRYAPEPGKADTRSAETVALSRAIAGLLPNADLPMTVTMAPFAVPGQRSPAVAITLGVRQPVPADAAGQRLTETTELQSSAFTPEGDPRGSQRHTARITLRPGAGGEAQYEVLARLDLPPGRYRLRLAAHNATSGKSGSVFADVEIPDFANDPLSVSGVILSARPGRPSAPREVLASILPVVPTAERAFLVSEDVTTFLRVYQSGRRPIAPVEVALAIHDARGAPLVSETRVLGVDRFAAPEPPLPIGAGGRSVPRGGPPVRAGAQDAFANPNLRTADVRYELPLARLGPGPHLFTVETRQGTTTIRRAVRFFVR